MDQAALAKLRKRLEKLFKAMGSANRNESDIARDKLNALLRKNGKNWNDVLELIQTGKSTGSAWAFEDDDREKAAAQQTQAKGWDPSALELVHGILQVYVDLQPHQYVAVALWILHSYVYHQFMCSPRLALTSPVRVSGKTTLLNLIQRLRPLVGTRRTDGITAAAIYDLVDREHCTLLVDEADNLGLGENAALRAVLNSGHRKGGTITRGRPAKEFSTFAPMALAVIGTLPLPLMHRCIVISMRRKEHDDLKQLDDGDQEALNTVFLYVRRWVGSKPNLSRGPAMPTKLRNRQADNWRALVSIADAFGPEWGARAREAAVALTTHHDEDPAVTLLSDIRDIFDARAVDRLTSVELVAALNDVDDSPWSEWRGVGDNRQPRKLSLGELARLLKPFSIRPRSVWPPHREKTSKSAKGYFRSQFEDAWASYCQGGTTAQPSNIRHLRRHGSGT